MRLKYNYILGQPDIKDESGLWVKNYRSNDMAVVKTRSAALWNAMVDRTKVGSASQRNCPTYEGCENMFFDYQEFTDWCQTQYGYMNKDSNGKFWHLDKDILVLDNKIYSPETCLFVPNRVNSLFIKGIQKGPLPLGVTMTGPNKDIYTGSATFDGVFRKTKVCKSAEEAHAFWQSGKLDMILFVMREEEVRSHAQLTRALIKRAVRLKYDIDNGLETTII